MKHRLGPQETCNKETSVQLTQYNTDLPSRVQPPAVCWPYFPSHQPPWSFLGSALLPGWDICHLISFNTNSLPEPGPEIASMEHPWYMIYHPFIQDSLLSTYDNPCSEYSELESSRHIPDLKEWVSESLSVMSNSLWPHGLYSPRNSPGQNIGVRSLSLLQGIFPTQGSNPGLPHCRQILYQLSYQGSLTSRSI